jgi:F0F1-type ATP synthase assembly protein I
MAGLIVGTLLGVPLGWLLYHMFSRSTPLSLIVERDKETNLITGVHYLPASVGARG